MLAEVEKSTLVKVAVIGSGDAVGDALSVIAGYTVGQDLSDRVVQFEGGANPQSGPGKSVPGFGPIGPWVVSADDEPRELLHPGSRIDTTIEGIGTFTTRVFGR